MELTIRQTYSLIQLKMSRTELDSFKIEVCADKLAIGRSDNKFFLVTLEENHELDELDITTIYRATKESIQIVFGLWMRDLMDDIEDISVEVDLLDLSYVEISKEDEKIMESLG